MEDRIKLMQDNSLITNYISDGLIIPTGSIRELWEEKVKIWMMEASTGAIIYSRPRVGKTTAIDYVANKIDELFQGGIPVIRWNITNHAITERNFYSSLLMAMGISEPNRGSTALVLKARVLNILTELACEGCSDTACAMGNSGMLSMRRIVMFCDEAYLLDEKDFNWLMDLYNCLRNNKVYLSVFLVGSYELKNLKSYFISIQKDQIIGRFMIDEHVFTGIRSKEEMAICLGTFDSPLKIPGISGKEIIPVQHFFPDAYAEGTGMYYLLTDIFWNAFQDVKEKSKLSFDDIPMKYFIRSITTSMILYGKGGSKESHFLDTDAVLNVVRSSGYAMSGGTSDVLNFKNKKYGARKK